MEARGEVVRVLDPPSVFEGFLDALVAIRDDEDLGFRWKSVFLKPLSNTRNETVTLKFVRLLVFG
jgi:hypothetical protein